MKTGVGKWRQSRQRMTTVMGLEQRPLTTQRDIAAAITTPRSSSLRSRQARTETETANRNFRPSRNHRHRACSGGQSNTELQVRAPTPDKSPQRLRKTCLQARTCCQASGESPKREALNQRLSRMQAQVASIWKSWNESELQTEKLWKLVDTITKLTAKYFHASLAKQIYSIYAYLISRCI